MKITEWQLKEDKYEIIYTNVSGTKTKLTFFSRIQMILWKMEKNMKLTTIVKIRYDENNDAILLAKVLKTLFSWWRMKNILVYRQTSNIMPTLGKVKAEKHSVQMHYESNRQAR